MEAQIPVRVARTGTEDDVEIAALISGLGRAVNMATLYGLTHPLTLNAMEQVIPCLAPALASRGKVMITLLEGVLQVDGKPVDSRVQFANVLSNKLRDLNLTGFALLQGMDIGEFRKLVQLLASFTASAAQADFHAALERDGLHHVVADRGVYRRVSDGPGAASATHAGAGPSGNGDAPANEIVVGQILAFLKGSAGADQSAAAAAVRDMASSPEKLAQLIMEATVIRQSPTGLAAGESMADLVVGCLHRTLDSLITQPQPQTPEGRANLKKSLIVLEQCVLDRLRQKHGGPLPDVERAVKRAFGEARDEFEVAAAAREYVRRREALDKVEQWMVSYLHSRPERGLPGGRLEKRLSEAGLTPDGWQALVQKNSGVGAPGGSAESGAGAGGPWSPPAELGVLSVLLSQLDELMGKETVSPGRVSALVSEAHTQTESLARKTDAKVKKLAKQMPRKPAHAHEESPAALLAEIAQELAQPVSVLNCTVDMLTRGCLGEVLPQQRDILTIARGCGMRVGYLLDQLRRAVGLPEGLAPMSKQQLTQRAPR